MKTTIRYPDAHVPWAPKPDITKVIPKPCWSEGFMAPRESLAAPVIHPRANAEREFVDGWKRRETLKAKPHPWHDRRKDVIEQFTNVRESVTPIGYEDAWDPEMKFQSAADEWKYIEATQDNELAPEWLTFRANGIRGESLDRLVESDDGDYSMGELVTYDHVNGMLDYEHAYELLGGMRRIEAFLKAEDEQKWFTGRTRRYWWAVNDEGKRGLLRMNRSISDKQFALDWEDAKQHMPSVESIERAMEHRAEHITTVMDQQGRQVRQYDQATFHRDEKAIAEGKRAFYEDYYIQFEPENLILTEAEEQDALDEQYLPNTPCPNTMCGERTEDCVVCMGEGYILHTLGVDGEMDSTYGTWRGEQRALPRWTRKFRREVNRLDKEAREAAMFKPKGIKTPKQSLASLDSLPF